MQGIATLRIKPDRPANIRPYMRIHRHISIYRAYSQIFNNTLWKLGSKVPSAISRNSVDPSSTSCQPYFARSTPSHQGSGTALHYSRTLPLGFHPPSPPSIFISEGHSPTGAPSHTLRHGISSREPLRRIALTRLFYDLHHEIHTCMDKLCNFARLARCFSASWSLGAVSRCKNLMPWLSG